MDTSEKTWIDAYYEIVAFFYWDSRTLGKKRDPAGLSNLRQVEGKLRMQETPLNHHIKHFLYLAPLSLRNRLFELALGKDVPGQLIMAGSTGEINDALQLGNLGQPDFLFTTDSTTVSLEMKIDSKSSTDQVLKYALTSLAIEQMCGREMQHYLAFLGKGSFADIWRKATGITSIEDLKLKAIDDRGRLLKKLMGPAKRFRDCDPRYLQILESLSIGFLNYNSFADLIRAEMPTRGGSTGAEVYHRLIDGMVGELTRRHLVSECLAVRPAT